MRALILDDDPEVRQAMASALQEAGCDQVDTVGDPFDAIGLVFRMSYDLVLLDPQLRGMSGRDLLLLLHSRLRHSVVAVVSACPDRVAGAERGCVDLVIAKPFETERILRLARLARELAEKRAEIGELSD